MVSLVPSETPGTEQELWKCKEREEKKEYTNRGRVRVGEEGRREGGWAAPSPKQNQKESTCR